MKIRSVHRFQWLTLLPLLAVILVSCSDKPAPRQQGSTGSKPKIEVAFVTNGVASFWTIAKVANPLGLRPPR